MNISDSLPYILLPFVCLSFDEALKIPFINKKDVLRSLVDNGGHGSIAFVCWWAVVGMTDLKRKDFVEMVVCGVIACAIDLDHFISAKSFSLKDALSLDHRPPLHSTSILIPILLCVTGLSLYNPVLQTLPLIVTVSIISHHVRDGHRRGIWFWPIGSTPAIPYWLYLTMIAVLPAVVTIMRITVKKRIFMTIDEQSDLV